MDRMINGMDRINMGKMNEMDHMRMNEMGKKSLKR